MYVYEIYVTISLARIEKRQKGDERIVRPRPSKTLWRFTKRAARFTLVPRELSRWNYGENQLWRQYNLLKVCIRVLI